MSDLNRFIAEALGKTVALWQAEDDLYLRETTPEGLVIHTPCPHWDTSLDAITREIEAAGYVWQVRGPRLIDGYAYFGELYAYGRLVSIAHATTAAAALGEAFLLALAERKGQGR